MAAEWPVMSIAECAADEPYATQIGPFGKALTPEEYIDTGVPLLRGVNVNHGRFYDDGYVFISDETADRLSKFESHSGDVLLVHKGTLGQIGLMPKERKFKRYIMGNSMLRVKCNENLLLPDYLYYWLCSAAGQHYLFSRVSQVGVPQIQRPLTTLREARLPVPPIPVQRSITRLLGGLDDKIDLSGRMNETLEAIAQTLFQSWFVDFDPVRAKAEGREPPGLDAETAALFPDSFEDSPIGPTPLGWQASTLGDCADFVSGGTPNKSHPEYWGGSIPWVSAKDMKTPRLLDAEDHITPLGAANGTRTVPAGSILLLVRGMMLHNDVPICIAMTELAFNQDVKALRPRPEIGHEFLYLWLADQKPFLLASVDAASHGTGRIHSDLLKNAELALPPEKILVAFRQAVSPLFDRLRLNDEECRTLGELRDTLLPKLLSGEVRVADAARAVEEAI